MVIAYNKKIGDILFVCLKDEQKGQEAVICPSLGACLYELWLSPTGNSGQVHMPLRQIIDNDGILNVDDGNTAAGSRNIFYKSAILLPFPNRISGGRYTFAGVSYQLPTNEVGRGHALHGFLHCASFELSECGSGDQEAFCCMKHVFEGLETGYPFRFEVSVCYVLSLTKGLYCHTRVVSLNTGAMPLGVGWHPYFWAGNGQKIDTFRLQLPSPIGQITTAANTLIPITDRVHTNNDWKQPAYLADTSFDTGFCLSNGAENRVLLRFDDSFAVQLFMGRSYPFLQIYTPPHRQSIALEPMSCAADAFNNKWGLSVLESAGQCWEGYWGIVAC